jgi:hypothetical protein
MPDFTPFPLDPDPDLPESHLRAIVAAAHRTRKHARTFARPYGQRAAELLAELNASEPGQERRAQYQR